MNREEIFEIIERFEASDLSSLSIKDRDFSIEMVRGSQASKPPEPKGAVIPAMHQVPAAQTSQAASADSGQPFLYGKHGNRIRRKDNKKLRICDQT